MVKYDEKHTKRKRNIIREGNIERSLKNYTKNIRRRKNGNIILKFYRYFAEDKKIEGLKIVNRRKRLKEND